MGEGLGIKLMKVIMTMMTMVHHLLYTYFVPRIVINIFQTLP